MILGTFVFTLPVTIGVDRLWALTSYLMEDAWWVSLTKMGADGVRAVQVVDVFVILAVDHSL